MIEIISRQSNLESHDLTAEISAGQLRAILHKMFAQLNQRLPVNNGVHIEQCTEWLMYWLLTADDTSGSGSIRLFTLKIALGILCYGKLRDKLICECTAIDTSLPPFLVTITNVNRVFPIIERV